MKILIFDEWFPWPLDCGKKIRTFNLVRRLCERHQIIYVAFAKMPDDQAAVAEMSRWCYKVVPVDDTRLKKWTPLFYGRVVLNIFEKVPFSTVYHVTQDFERTLLREVRTESPDLIQCEWTNLAPYLANISGIPVVISSHNIESDIWKRYEENNSSSLPRRVVGRQQARRIEDLERFWYKNADSCIAVSNLDKAVIESYGGRAFTVENGVDMDYYSFPCEEVSPKDIVFTASFDTFSNEDGAEYLIEKIFPIIASADPAIRVLLVGKNPPQRLYERARKHPNILLTGSVPDVRPYISRSVLSIVPLRIGGGTRLKILEALAMRKAVVSTSVGAEGIDAVHCRDIMIADTAEEFAKQVLLLIGNEQKRNEIASAGYALVKEKYDWDVLSSKLDAAWKQTLTIKG